MYVVGRPPVPFYSAFYSSDPSVHHIFSCLASVYTLSFHQVWNSLVIQLNFNAEGKILLGADHKHLEAQSEEMVFMERGYILSCQSKHPHFHISASLGLCLAPYVYVFQQRMIYDRNRKLLPLGAREDEQEEEDEGEEIMYQAPRWVVCLCKLKIRRAEEVY